MKVLSLIAVLTAAALAVAGSAFSSRSSTPTLTGTVGPGYTIHLTKGGKKVASLKAGKYKFSISDKSDFHDFTVEEDNLKTVKAIEAEGGEAPHRDRLHGHEDRHDEAHDRQLELLLLEPRSPDARRLQGHEVARLARGRQQAAASATSGTCT